MSLENIDKISSYFCFFPGNTHMFYVFVFVYLNVCVGTDDGAQEVVKEILEDVVTSVVKGKN